MESTPSIVLVGHDPGSRNALQPIYARAKAEPELRVVWVDLTRHDSRDMDLDAHCGVLVVGTSTNKAEIPWVEMASRRGLPTVTVLDMPGGAMATHKLMPLSSPSNIYIVPDVETSTLISQLLEQHGASARCRNWG